MKPAAPRPARALPRPRFIGLRIQLAVVFVGLILGADAFFIEPYRLEVTHHALSLSARGFRGAPVKIALISDLHTHGLGRRERKMLAALDEERPDVILVAGDSLGGYGGTYTMVCEVLSRLHAPMGVWVVFGNWERHWEAPNERAFYTSCGVHLMINEAEQLRPGLWVIGLDDPTGEWADLDAAIGVVPRDAFPVTFFHAPAYFHEIAGRVPLVLAAHTHGGQVRLPYMKPFWLPRASKPYLEGWYEEKGSLMYVTRGIGMSFLPMRFLCRPELAIITLHE